MTSIFTDLEKNKGRQHEFDLVKAFTIVLMIWTHTFESISTCFEPSISAFNAYYRGAIFGASTFMFCMGMGMVYTRSSSPKDYFKRGIKLLFAGILLSIFREILPEYITYLLNGDISVIYPSVTCLGVDILQFAGLAFLLMALLRKIGLRYRYILIVSALMSIGAWFLEGVQTGNYAFDQALGFLWGTDTESYFPLMNWFIYVAAGCWFGKLYRHLDNKAAFQKICFPIGLVITAGFLIISFKCDQNIFIQFKEERFLAHRMFPDSVMTILSNVWLISLFYYISLLIPQKALPVLTHPSKHINQYYCISWVIIYGILRLAFFYENQLSTDLSVILMWLGVLALTIATVIVYNRYLKERMDAFFGKHYAFWVILALLVFFAGSIYAFIACDGAYPNFLNGYSITN